MSPRQKGTRRKKAPRRLHKAQKRLGTPLPPGARKRASEWFGKLVALQARLRATNGCPWDREQTHESLRTYLLEETYEALEALDEQNDVKLAEELGDLLLQIVFHAEIARQEKRFEVADVIHGIHNKLVRRHPHVFGGARAKDTAEVLKNWEQLKAAERGTKKAAQGKEKARAAGRGAQKSLVDGLPRTLPATLEAFQLTRRAARIGFDWEQIEGILDKLREESAELRHAVESKRSEKIEEELGDLLFVAVNIARFLGKDPELALKKANRKFKTRFQSMERLARSQGQLLAEVPRDEMERLWDSAKRDKSVKAAAASAAPERHA